MSSSDERAVCTEAGMSALRERKVHVTQEDFEMAVAKVMKKATEKNCPQGSCGSNMPHSDRNRMIYKLIRKLSPSSSLG
ncbi:hypothetical protein AAC387_Pa08g1015 [Persea americana]